MVCITKFILSFGQTEQEKWTNVSAGDEFFACLRGKFFAGDEPCFSRVSRKLTSFLPWLSGTRNEGKNDEILRSAFHPFSKLCRLAKHISCFLHVYSINIHDVS